MASTAAPNAGAQFPYFAEEHDLIRQTARQQIAPVPAGWMSGPIARFWRDVRLCTIGNRKSEIIARQAE
jgi:hypothetical protein